MRGFYWRQDVVIRSGLASPLKVAANYISDCGGVDLAMIEVLKNKQESKTDWGQFFWSDVIEYLNEIKGVNVSKFRIKR